MPKAKPKTFRETAISVDGMDNSGELIGVSSMSEEIHSCYKYRGFSITFRLDYGAGQQILYRATAFNPEIDDKNVLEIHSIEGWKKSQSNVEASIDRVLASFGR